MALAEEWTEAVGLPDRIKKAEGSIKQRMIDRLEAGEYRLGISLCYQVVCEIVCDRERSETGTPEQLMEHYIKRLFAAGAGITYVDSAMVFPCMGSSIVCVDYASLNEGQPLLLAVADTAKFQSRRYGILRDLADGRAAACVLAALNGDAQDSLSFLREGLFSGGRLKYALERGDYTDILAVFDALACRLLLDSRVMDQAEPDVEEWQSYLSDRRAFDRFCRELLLQRGKVVKVNGKPNVRMYALMDYVQHIHGLFDTI